jgi:lysine 2,3-aminomutase
VSSAWRDQLRLGARDLSALVDRGLLTPAQAAELEPVAARYEMLVSDYYLSLIDPDDPDDPIRKQALPSMAELRVRPDERADPIGDGAHAATPVLIHRYPDRALLFPTFRCPMFCRYCFRKVALNDEPVRLRRELERALDYLRATPAVEEVILSGGDPLMLADARLDALLGQLRAIPSVKRLRLHTRFPVTLPMRVDASLAAMLARHRPLYVVTHFNLARELTPEATAALRHLTDAGLTVLNQSVLLRGVNDSVGSLTALMRGLVNRQVRPYYLHHPDLTVGTQHFRVSLDRGLRLFGALRGALSGLALPTYVIDVPGGGGKVPVDSHWVERLGGGRWRLRSPLGADLLYDDPASEDVGGPQVPEDAPPVVRLVGRQVVMTAGVGDQRGVSGGGGQGLTVRKRDELVVLAVE